MVASISAAYWKTIDTVVMGRRTYEVAVKNGTTAYPGVKNYVFSKTMRERSREATAAHRRTATEQGAPGS